MNSTTVAVYNGGMTSMRQNTHLNTDSPLLSTWLLKTSSVL